MLQTRVSSCVAGVFLVCAALIAEEAINTWTAPPFWTPPERVVAEDRFATMDAEGVEGLPTSPLPFHAITPCRIVDTRPLEGFTGAYGPPALVANAMRDFDLNSAPHCAGIPANAEAYSLNVTVTGTLGPGDIRIWPTGTFALVSTQNWPGAGVTLANAAIVPAGTNGSVTVQAAGSGTHLIIDINGYYAGAVVTTLNGLSGAVTLAGSSSVTVTPAGNTLTLSAGGPGGLLPSGFSGQTLRHNGSSWVASSVLTNNGTNLDISGVTNIQIPRILAGNIPFLHAEEIGAQANTYVGLAAGDSPSPGIGNTAVGHQALRSPQGSSSVNVAVGENALVFHQTGNSNVAVGVSALHNLTSGSGNIAIGTSAGLGNIPGFPSLTTGSNNIYIGNRGSGDESGQIRIGTNGVHTQGTVIASIHGFGSGGGIPVIVNAGGRLGTTTSSARYKQDVRNVGGASDGLMSLRPVAFKYKESHEAGGLTQYGLIAEEVAEVYPELVVYDDEGRPQAIRSQLLDPLLLNEIQKQRREIQDLKARLEELERKSAP